MFLRFASFIKILFAINDKTAKMENGFAYLAGYLPYPESIIYPFRHLVSRYALVFANPHSHRHFSTHCGICSFAVPNQNICKLAKALNNQMMNFLTKKIIQPLLQFLKQGVTPKKMALTLSLGLVFGIFPVIGTSTLLCTALALVFRLNMAIMQIANYLAYPLQIILLIPLMKFGTELFSSGTVSFSLEELTKMFQNNFLQALQILGMSQIYAIFMWAMFSIPFGIVLYWLLFGIFKRFEKQKAVV